MSTRSIAESRSVWPTLRARFHPALAAEAALLALVIGLATTVRLAGLADPTDLSDEGIRGTQLRLLAAGFKPVSEIYSSQGPLSLWLFYPAVALFGPDILVGRLTAVGASLIVLIATAWVGRQLGGPVAGVASGLVLALSPVFLASSRRALVEVPSIAPVMLGLVALMVFRRDGRRRWLVLAGALFAVGMLAKPMVAIASPAVLVLLLAPHEIGAARASRGPRPVRHRLFDLGLFASTALFVCASVVLAVGAADLYEQVVAHRVGARSAHGWDLATNGDRIAEHLRANGWGILLAAAAGGVVALRDRRPSGVAFVAWLGGGLAVLLLYSPLWGKHVTYVLPPLAVLAGLGFASVVPLAARPRDRLQLALGGAAAIAVCLVIASLPDFIAEMRASAYDHDVSNLSRHADDLLVISTATSPSDFVVVDDTYLGMMTGRAYPPLLADLSWGRIRARTLTADQAIDATRRFEARILILQDGHLGWLRRYRDWADREYVLVKSYVQRRPTHSRRVYAHPDVDLGALGEALRSSLDTATDIRMGPTRLLGYELERRKIELGSRVGLTLMLEAVHDHPTNHVMVVRLRDRSGRATWKSEWKIGDGSQELRSWKAGRWQAQTLRLLITNVPKGNYSLTISLQPVSGAATTGSTGDEVNLGEVSISQ